MLETGVGDIPGAWSVTGSMTVHGQVPLSELNGYQARLNGMTGGQGRYTIELARSGYDVVLCDLTPENLAFARRQIARAGVKQRDKYGSS